MTRGSASIVLALLLALPAVAADAPHIGTADLTCGAARLHARTASVAHVAPDDGLAWVSQEITLQGPGGVPSRLHVVGRRPATRDRWARPAGHRIFLAVPERIAGQGCRALAGLQPR